MKKEKIYKITTESFQPFGKVIEFPKSKKNQKRNNLFHIVLTEKKATGWRIAYLIIRDKQIKVLEHHPMSFESFEPLYGETLLYVCKRTDFSDIKCFLLDKPVILNKGLWHGVTAQSYESAVKISENAKVRCVYKELDFYLPR
ncbi:MAG: hypothetical protein PHV17_02880 [Candidatus Omnitrophica bacterium]|nr:hypothetical protein [Candidatus Omnitrophota bacterium]